MSPLNLVMTLMAVVTLSIGVFLNNVNTNSFRNTEVQAPDVLSLTTQTTPTPSASPSSSPFPSSTPKITSKPSATPIVTNSNTELALEALIYPGSTIDSKLANSLNLISSTEPKIIIAWYQSKLKELNMNATSIASTNTNGNYLTKMAAATSITKINIEIAKTSSQSDTHIKINLSN